LCPKYAVLNELWTWQRKSSSAAKKNIQSKSKHNNKEQELPSVNLSLAETSIHSTKEIVPKKKEATVSQTYKVDRKNISL
jgi:hypothetical protein